MNELHPVAPNDRMRGVVNLNILDLDEVPGMGTDSRVSCVRCPAACCRIGTRMELSSEEVNFMRDSGTELEPMPEVKKGFFGHKKENRDYILRTNCGNLAVDADGNFGCAAHENPDRPKICKDFKVGSYGCVALQLARIQQGDVNRPDWSTDK